MDFDLQILWVILGCLASWNKQCWGSVTDQLRYYETLSQVHVSSFVKRSYLTNMEFVKTLHFKAFGEDIHLTLRPGTSVLAKNFRARLVHKDGSYTPFSIDQSKIFTGHESNNVQSKVHAHMENSLWSLYIIRENDIYAVEPAWRILSPSEIPSNHTMVAYRMSDLIDTSKSFPMFDVQDDLDASKVSFNHVQLKELFHEYVTRHKRKAKYTKKLDPRTFSRQRKNTCLAYLVGDTDFFIKRCARSYFTCSSVMIQYLNMADDIFTKSPFMGYRKVYLGFGLQLAHLEIFTDYSNTGAVNKTDVRHFNEEVPVWTSMREKLRSFATHTQLTGKRYCLNHLLTEMQDNGGKIGLAFPSMVCYPGPSYQKRALNSAVTSGTNRNGRLHSVLLTSLVFTHEMGHIYGAMHDPDTEECAPLEHEGGKYLMWFWNSGYITPNSKRFSPCSLREIGRSLDYNPDCFVERAAKNYFCGNGELDPGEYCDVGGMDTNYADKCCNEKCQFRPGAVCSDMNHDCCVDCQIASASTVCEKTRTATSCLNDSYCLGTDTVCVKGNILQDGTSCGDMEMQHCSAGICTTPCEKESAKRKGLRLKACECTRNATEGCMWCCFDMTDPTNPGECKPILPEPRVDGTPCYRGFCQKGMCLPQIILRKTRRDAFIKFMKRSTLEEFLKANIVLVVVVLSLILWIPPSIWIHSKDMEERRLSDLIEDLYENLPHAEGEYSRLKDFSDTESEDHIDIFAENEPILNVSFNEKEATSESIYLSSVATTSLSHSFRE